MSDRLQCSLQAIDAANARDPTHDAGEPAEFIYGRPMMPASRPSSSMVGE